MAFIGVTGETHALENTVVFATPSGVSEGDRLLFAFSIVDRFQEAKDGGFAPPSGEYDRIYVDPDDTTGVIVYTKVVGPSEPATHTFTLDPSYIQQWFCGGYDACEISAISGQRAVTPEWIAPSVDVEHPGSTLVTIVKAISPEIADGQTLRISQLGTFTTNILQLTDEEPSTGPTGTRSESCVHYGWSAINIVLAPIESGGGEEGEAIVAVTLPAFEVSATAALESVAAVVATLPALVVNAAASMSATATVAAELPAFAVTAVSSTEASAVASVGLPAFEAAAEAAMSVTASAVVLMPAFVAAAESVTEVSASVAVELPAFEALVVVVDGSASTSVVASVDLPAFVVAAQAEQSSEATAAVELPAFVASVIVAPGEHVESARVAVALPAFEVAAIAEMASSAVASVSLPAFDVSAVAALESAVIAVVELPAFVVSATTRVLNLHVPPGAEIPVVGSRQNDAIPVVGLQPSEIPVVGFR